MIDKYLCSAWSITRACKVIDDSYNASYESISALSNYVINKKQKKIIILGYLADPMLPGTLSISAKAGYTISNLSSFFALAKSYLHIAVFLTSSELIICKTSILKFFIKVDFLSFVKLKKNCAFGSCCHPSDLLLYCNFAQQI